MFYKDCTIDNVFKNSVKKFGKNTFLEYPNAEHKKKIKYTYEETNYLVNKYKKKFFNIGLCCDDRVAIMIGNIPEFFIIKLSLNVLGVSTVPLNHELTKTELEYQLQHSSSKMIITNNKYLCKFKGIKYIKNNGLCTFDNLVLRWLKYPKLRKKINKLINPSTEASLLYTSGTTGKPKGCILSHEYEINAGFGYVNKKGLISIKNAKDKIYNCLPVHHVNAGILSFYAVLLTGNCQIQAERFSASLFWKHIKESKATIFHYLGVMAPILLKNNKSFYEKDNCLRLGVGAGIEPQLHKTFETKFKVPMIELWGMTEMVRCIFDHTKNRKVGKRCFGKPDKSLETKVIGSNGKSIYNSPGEFLIRYRKIDPRKGFFSGYLNDKKATNNVWKGGWFNTGDIVKKDKRGNLYFIDRKKNIIRRAGENISSAEVEASLLALPFILNCAVIPVPHNIYEEEILAFIVLKNKDVDKTKLVSKIMNLLRKKLTYFKLPYYIQFTSKIPKTSTEKIKKNELLKMYNKQSKKEIFNVSNYKKIN